VRRRDHMLDGLDQEIRDHIERETLDNIERGMPPEEARYAALRKFGNVMRVKEETRAVWSALWLEQLLQDVRFGLRNLNKDRRFTLLAILTLALGIGATTVIFSAMDSILLEPFIYAHADRLAIFFIHDLNQPNDNGRSSFSVPEFMDFREQNHVFEDVAGYSGQDVLYAGNQGAHLFDGAWVTANSFDLLGMKPFLGRAITSDDGKPGAAPVFAMSYRLWTKQFNRDPGIVGTTMTLNDQPRTLVGIMPPRFLWGNCDIWMPIYWTHSDLPGTNAGHPRMFLSPLARLKPGVSLQAATADLNVVAFNLSKVYSQDYPPHFDVITGKLRDEVVGQFRFTLYVLMAAVSMLLLIACCNVANLLLARATAREREIAIRASMGATHSRLIRQLLVESFLLSVAGCAAGCLFAYFGLKWIQMEAPLLSVPAEALIALKPAALWFALCVTILTTFLCGLAPALHAVHGDLYPRLTGAGRGAGAGFRHGKLRAGLVIFEVGLSILLLIGAGLMMRTVLALQHVDLGFNPRNILVVRPAFPPGRYDTAVKKRVFFEQVMQRIAALPGVIAVTETSTPPAYAYSGIGSEVTIPGTTHADSWTTIFRLCGTDYFRTLGIPLIRGRALSEADVDSASHVVVINQTFASKYFKDEDPIGKQIKFDQLDQIADAPHNAYFQVIGITGDIKNQGLRDAPMPEACLPYTITGGYFRRILVRTAVDPLSLLPNVRQEISAVDSSVALAQTDTIESYLTQWTYAEPDFAVTTLGIFAVIGLALVIIGVLGVMAYSVSLQTQEIGVRIALGAQQSDILKMVLLKGLRLIAAGVVIGVLASYVATRLIASQIWGVSPTDPLTFAAVVTTIILVGLAACLIPARRATRVDPMVALRYE
jgi:predicted permease